MTDRTALAYDPANGSWYGSHVEPEPEPDELRADQLSDMWRDMHADMQREIARAPEVEDDIRARYHADTEPIKAELGAHNERLRTELYWRQRGQADPVATGLMELLLQARSDEDVWSIFTDIAGRFRSAATPPADDALEAFVVHDIDANNPPRPMSPLPDKAALRREMERRAEPKTTHDDPLNLKFDAEQRRRRDNTRRRTR